MELNEKITAQKMKLSIEGFFSKCDQIRSFNPKKSLMENFIFCAVNTSESWQVSIFSEQQRTWNTIAIFFLILHHGPMSLSEVALSCNCKWAIGQKQINNGSAGENAASVKIHDAVSVYFSYYIILFLNFIILKAFS